MQHSNHRPHVNKLQKHGFLYLCWSCCFICLNDTTFHRANFVDQTSQTIESACMLSMGPCTCIYIHHSFICCVTSWSSTVLRVSSDRDKYLCDFFLRNDASLNHAYLAWVAIRNAAHVMITSSYKQKFWIHINSFVIVRITRWKQLVYAISSLNYMQSRGCYILCSRYWQFVVVQP